MVQSLQPLNNVMYGKDNIQSFMIPFPICSKRAMLEFNKFSVNNETQMKVSTHLILDELKRNGVTEITIKKHGR